MEWLPIGGGALLWEKAPYLLLSVGFVVLNIAARHYEPIAQPTYRENFFTWTLHQLAAPAFYLWKAILPIGLSPAYELTGWSVPLCRGWGGHLRRSRECPRQMASSRIGSGYAIWCSYCQYSAADFQLSNLSGSLHLSSWSSLGFTYRSCVHHFRHDGRAAVWDAALLWGVGLI